MQTIKKELHPAEVKRRAICIHSDSQKLVGQVGQTIKIKDQSTQANYSVLIGSQHRLCMRDWYAAHPGIKPGDIVEFKVGNGEILLSHMPSPASKSNALNPSSVRRQVLDIVVDALSCIEDGTTKGRVTMKGTSIVIEWGDEIPENEVIIGENSSKF